MGRKTTQIEMFDPDRVRPLPEQPRKRFAGIRELADSISEIGQTSPGLVVPIGKHDPDRERYDVQLVDGERRLRACKMAGVEFRAEVRDAQSIEDLFVASFGANFGKQDHDPLEIAEGLARLQRAGKTLQQMSRIAGKSPTWVQQHLNLLKLHPSVQQLLVVPEGDDDARAGEKPPLSYHVAQTLTNVDEAMQIKLAKTIQKQGLSLVASRRLVLKARSKAGDDPYRRIGGGKGSRVKLVTIQSILADFSDRIGIYLDMPGAELNAQIDALDTRTKRLLVESIEDVGESLEILADTVQKRLPKVGAATR